MWIILSISICIGAAVLAAYFFLTSGRPTHKQILIDLGLKPNVDGSLKTAFYKWGWRKQNTEQVWAEYIVKEAFKNAGIWLAKEDLQFFEAACRVREKGKDPNEEQIFKRVDTIVKRMNAVRHTIIRHVNEVMNLINYTPPKEAQALLEEKGIDVEEETSVIRYGTYHIRQKLAVLGKQALGYQEDGVPIIDHKGNTLYKMHGMPSWKILLSVYIEETKKRVRKLARGLKAGVYRSIEQQLKEGLLSDYEEDIANQQQFTASMEKEIHAKTLECKMDDLYRIDAVFYQWLFADAIPMNMVDLKRVRKMLSGKNLAGRFRQMIIEGIHPKFETSKKVFDLFPRHVIFYGKDDSSRSFAAERYQSHYKIMLETFAPIFRIENHDPVLVHVPLKEINRIAEEETQRLQKIDKYAHLEGVKQGENQFDVSKLLKLLDFQKSLAIHDKSEEINSGEKRGWLINYPVSDEHPETFALLETPQYKPFSRFNCDSAGEIDCKSNTFHARKQREIFFTLILDVLTNRADLNNSKHSSLNKENTQSVAV